ncbi:MAG: RNA 2',3'-cyclic phosphodiesterase [Candidatus Binataceae bacterium]
MTHWSEGTPRQPARENFPERGAAGIRAFVAIRMSEAVEEKIGALIDRIRHPNDCIRWVRRANLHVTLKFLGPAVDPRRLAPFADAMRALAARTAPFEIEARGVGAFPDLDRPRVIWVRLESVELGALAARVEAAAAECGFAREERHWSGHLTIGRIRDPHGFTPTRAELAEAAREEFGASRIESITLYRSHLAPEGSTYEALATFLFGVR